MYLGSRGGGGAGSSALVAAILKKVALRSMVKSTKINAIDLFIWRHINTDQHLNPKLSNQ